MKIFHRTSKTSFIFNNLINKFLEKNSYSAIENCEDYNKNLLKSQNYKKVNSNSNKGNSVKYKLKTVNYKRSKTPIHIKKKNLMRKKNMVFKRKNIKTCNIRKKKKKINIDTFTDTLRKLKTKISNKSYTPINKKIFSTSFNSTFSNYYPLSNNIKGVKVNKVKYISK